MIPSSKEQEKVKKEEAKRIKKEEEKKKEQDKKALKEQAKRDKKENKTVVVPTSLVTPSTTAPAESSSPHAIQRSRSGSFINATTHATEPILHEKPSSTFVPSPTLSIPVVTPAPEQSSELEGSQERTTSAFNFWRVKENKPTTTTTTPKATLSPTTSSSSPGGGTDISELSKRSIASTSARSMRASYNATVRTPSPSTLEAPRKRTESVTSSAFFTSTILPRKTVVGNLYRHVSKFTECISRTNQIFLSQLYDYMRKENTSLDLKLRSFFSLFESMVGLNKVLQEELDALLKNWTDDSQLRTILQKTAGFFKMYASYSSQYSQVMTLLNTAAFENPRLETIIRKAEARMQTEYPSCTVPPALDFTGTREVMPPFNIGTVLAPANHDHIDETQYGYYNLASLLLVPVKFLFIQYQLLLQLSQVTPQTHADYPAVSSAVESLNENIDRLVQDNETARRTYTVQSKIKGIPFGFFGETIETNLLVKEGQLTEVTPPSGKISHAVLLFTNLLVFAELMEGGGFMMKKYHNVANCKAADPDVGFDNKKGFQLTMADTVMIMQAASEKDKSEWLACLNKTFEKAGSVVKHSMSVAADPADKTTVLDTFEQLLRGIMDGQTQELDFPFGALKADEAVRLASTLVSTTNQSIKSVSIVDNNLPTAALGSLCSWLRTTNNVARLTLVAIGLSPSRFIMLADVFRVNSGIAVLDIRNNGLGTAGATLLASSLNAASSLRELHIQNNNIDDKGMKAIAKALQYNHKLQVLGIESNPITGEALQYLVSCVELNLTSPLSVVSFDNAAFQNSIGSLLTYHKSRIERSVAVEKRTAKVDSFSIPFAMRSAVDLGYMGFGELSVQIINKANLLGLGNRRLKEIGIILLDNNQISSLPLPVLDQLDLTHLVASSNILKELTAMPLTRLVHLDLSRNKFASIPDVIFELPQLQLLDFSYNKIEVLEPAIKNLTHLHTLCLHRNNLTKLPLRELLSLTSIEYFTVSGNPSIPIIKQKILEAWPAKLTSLDLSNSGIEAVPTEIGLLTTLTELYLANNSIKTVPPQLGDLVNLRVLDLAHNQMESLPWQLHKITGLQKLLLEGNPNIFADILQVFGPSPSGQPVNLHDSDVATIIAYLKALAGEKQNCRRVKLMLVGQENVGKTTIARCLKKGVAKRPHLPINLANRNRRSVNFEDENINISTDGIDMDKWVPPVPDNPRETAREKEMNSLSFTIWDFGGQEVYYLTHSYFLSIRSVFLICFNMAQGDEASRVAYWIQCIEAGAPGSNIVIVGTHLDETSKDRVDQWTTEVNEKYLATSNSVRAFMPVSCKTGKNINKLQRIVVQLGQETSTAVGTTMPRALFQLESLLLSERLMHTPPIISRADYTQMAKCCGITDVPASLEELHRLGVILYFHDPQSELADLVILSPQWLNKLFTTIITTKRNFIKNGVLMHSHIEQIWRAPDFPPWLHRSLLVMLQRFELCFPLAEDPNNPGKRYLIPSLLPDERPAILKIPQLLPQQPNPPATPTGTPPPINHLPAHMINQSSGFIPTLSPSGFYEPLVRIFQYTFLPFGFFSRLMIRMMAFMDAKQYWKTGIVLGKDGCYALVEYQPALFQLQIVLWGQEAPKFVRYINEGINVLVSGWYRRLRSSIIIPCPCTACTLIPSDADDNDHLLPGIETTDSPVTTPKTESIKTDSPAGTPGAGTPNVGTPILLSPSGPRHDKEAKDKKHEKTKKNMSFLKRATMAFFVESTRSPPQKPLAGGSVAHHHAGQVDKAEGHLFKYQSCEMAVMEGKTHVTCEKSGIQVELTKLVPEVTMSDLSARFLTDFASLEVSDKIAEGGFGAVSKGTLKGELVAIKQLTNIPKYPEEAVEQFRDFWREVFVSSTLVHPCVVSLKAFTTSPTSMVMEFLPNGNLYSYLHTKVDIPWTMKLRILMNIADAMRFLHSRVPKLCHRDLKSPNCLMADSAQDPDIVCKVADFGESRMVATSGQGRENLANPLWLAPEVMKGGEYTEKCDVFSFAIIMWEVAAQKDPYDEYPVAKSGFMSQLEDAIVGGLRPTLPKSCPPGYQKLVEASWADDPMARPSFEEIYQLLQTIENPPLPPILASPPNSPPNLSVEGRASHRRSASLIGPRASFHAAGSRSSVYSTLRHNAYLSS